MNVLERFEVSFKNKAVRVWFYTVLPATLLAIALMLILPYEKNRYTSLGLTLVNILYFIWFVIYIRKKRG